MSRYRKWALNIFRLTSPTSISLYPLMHFIVPCGEDAMVQLRKGKINTSHMSGTSLCVIWMFPCHPSAYTLETSHISRTFLDMRYQGWNQKNFLRTEFIMSSSIQESVYSLKTGTYFVCLCKTNKGEYLEISGKTPTFPFIFTHSGDPRPQIHIFFHGMTNSPSSTA